MMTVQEQIGALERKVGPQATSPLFAQLAALYLNEGRAQDALRLCDSGLAHHPFYSTGHLIKGKALTALNMRAEARREFEYVLELLPGNPTVRELLKSVPPTADESLLPKAERVAPRAEPAAAPPPESEPPAVAHRREEPAATEQARVAPHPAAEELTPKTVGMPQAFLPPVEPERPGIPEEAELAVPAGEIDEDAFGAPTGFTPEPAAEEPPMAAEPEPMPVHEVSEPISAQAETTSQTEDPLEFGMVEASPETPTVVETPIAAEAAESPPFGEFNVPSETASFLSGIPEPEPEPAAVASAETPAADSAPDIGFDGTELLFAGPADEDTFEKYSLRIRAEISGEGTMTLEDYFDNVEPEKVATEPEPTIAQPKGRIEELAEKLQGARKITPVINITQKTPTAPSEQDTPASTGFVTPTLAEIYAKQGWYDDAIKAYRTLSVTKPAERDRFDKRIKELEELKRRNAGV
jgi:hypothetical protein